MKKTLPKAERERRAAVRAQATLEGFRSGVGDEVAILCRDCREPMLILAREGEYNDTRCGECGAMRFVYVPRLVKVLRESGFADAKIEDTGGGCECISAKSAHGEVYISVSSARAPSKAPM